MKKIIFLLITLFFLFQCGTEQADVERIMEDGAEVIINHIEPYKTKGEPSNLHLEEEFTIDTESDELAELGLTDINSFEVDSESQHRQNILQLYSPNFEKIKELDRCDYGKVIAFTQQKMTGTPRVFNCQVSGGLIHVGHEKRGYEILVYDLDGNLLKKIRKEYNPADVPDGFKENWLANIGRYEDRLVFPDKMPPFHYFFLDDQGRIYVKTYEEGTNQGEYMHDIFNPDGIFIARKSLPGYGDWIYPGDSLNRAKAKNNRFYCIREKESGFKELVVYKTFWE